MLMAKRSLRLIIFLLFTLCGKCVIAGVITKASQNLDGDKPGPLIVFLITEDPDNYKAHLTIPVFADLLSKEYGYNTRVLLGKGGPGICSFPNMEILSRADLLVVFTRRIALPHAQMKAIKTYLGKGKPLIGIRTANHAFTVRGKIENGFEDWPDFVTEILGCENRGYGPVLPGTDVNVVPREMNHAVLKNITSSYWHSNGNIYLVQPLLDDNAKILLEGKVNEFEEPIAWTRKAGNSKVFYTSLGYPDDFKTPKFKELLINAVKWTLSRKT